MRCGLFWKYNLREKEIKEKCSSLDKHVFIQNSESKWTVCTENSSGVHTTKSHTCTPEWPFDLEPDSDSHD